MSCPRCNSTNIVEIDGQWGPHTRKKECGACGRWIMWVSPKTLEERIEKRREHQRRYWNANKETIQEKRRIPLELQKRKKKEEIS